jgi:hypothetical protein
LTRREGACSGERERCHHRRQLQEGRAPLPACGREGRRHRCSVGKAAAVVARWNSHHHRRRCFTREKERERVLGERERDFRVRVRVADIYLGQDQPRLSIRSDGPCFSHVGPDDILGRRAIGPSYGPTARVKHRRPLYWAGLKLVFSLLLILSIFVIFRNSINTILIVHDGLFSKKIFFISNFNSFSKFLPSFGEYSRLLIQYNL